jgi:hypothetical protein
MDATLIDEFNRQLAETVVYKGNTDEIISSYPLPYGSTIRVSTCSGVNTYIPQPALFPEFYAAYRATAWSKVVYGEGL